ncbi:MAG: hypothetical protein O2V44_09710 [Candidatus Bathyarchaeota archaeon]|nr:hypothetical protein [Candidatus Bathyarchaeota archaeon]
MSKRSLLTLTSVFLLLATLGVFVNIPGVFGWIYWKYNTGNIVSDVAVSLGGNYTVAGTENGGLFLLNKQGTLIWSKSLGNGVEGVSISGDGTRILVGVAEYSSGEPDVFLFYKNGSTIWEKDLIDSGRPCDVSISQDGNYIATGDTNHMARFFDGSGDLLWQKEFGSWAASVSVSSEGDYVAAGSWDDNVYLFNQAGTQLWSYNTTNGVYGVSVSPEGGYVASVGGNIFFFNIGGDLLWNVTSYWGDDVSVSEDGNHIAAGKDDGEITLFDKTGGEVWNWTSGGGVNGVAIARNGEYVVGGGDEGFVQFIENLGPSSITCEFSDWQTYLGESVTIMGTIDPPHVGVEVTLTFTDPTETVFTRTTSTTGDGDYSDTLTPYLDGMWSVLASWSGDVDTMGAESSEVRLLVSTPTEVTVKIGRNQTVFNVFQPTTDYHYSPMLENIVWSESITSPSEINFTTIEGVYTYYEAFPGLGGTITSYNITYNIGVLEGTPEGTYAVTTYYNISRQSHMWPYSTTLILRYELRCTVNAVIQYETLIDLHLPAYVRVGEAVNVSGAIVPTGGPPVAGANVMLSYTKPDESVVNRTTVTGSDGSFQDHYVPDTLGNWSVKASWTGDEDHDGTESLQSQFTVLNPPVVSILLPENTIYTINQVPLTFTVTEPTYWMGYSLDGQTNVTITGNTTLTSLSDGTHYVIVYANDTAGNMATSNVVSFTVDTTPPTISGITRNPSIPDDGEAVTVTATVTDQHSGVNTVTLSYRIDGGSWVNIAMTKTNADIYEATIPGQSAETEVEYQIVAYDVAGHQVAEDNAGSYYVYTVIPESPSFLILPLFIMATLLAVIVFRRKLVASERKHSI